MALSQKALGLSKNSMLIATWLTVNTPSQLSLDYLCSGVVGVVRERERKGENGDCFTKEHCLPHAFHALVELISGSFLHLLIPCSSPHLPSGGLERHRHSYWDGRCQSSISCCCEVRV